jgi:hypothetical protein
MSEGDNVWGEDNVWGAAPLSPTFHTRTDGGELGEGGVARQLVVVRALLCGVVVPALDADLLGHKVGDGEGGEERPHHLRRAPALGELDAVVGGDEGRGVDDEAHVQRVRGVEDGGGGGALGAGPELDAGVLVGVVGREVVEELADLEVEVGVEEVAGELDAHGEGGALGDVEALERALELDAAGREVALVCDLGEPGRGVGDEGGRLHDGVVVGALEEVARPLDAVLDGVGEVAQRAHGDGVLGRVLGVGVGLGEVREDDLGVGLGAEGAGLHQRLAVEDAAGVDVLARLDVVEGVGDDVEVLPEGVVEGGLGVVADGGLERLHLELGVHGARGRGGGRALGLADVDGAEKELAVEVGGLDAVHVGDGDAPLGPAADAHEGKVLEELAAEGAGAHHKDALVHHARLEGAAEDGGEVVVAGVGGGELLGGKAAGDDGGGGGGGRGGGGGGRGRPRGRGGARGRGGGRLGEDLEGVEVEELADGRELARVLDDLLRDDAAEEGAEGGELGAREHGDPGDNVRLDVVGAEREGARLAREGGDPLLGEGDHLRGGGGVARGRQAARVLGAVELDGLEGDVELLAAAPLAEVRGEQHAGGVVGRERGVDADGEGLVGDRDGDLDLLDDAASDVLGPLAAVLPLELEAVRLAVGDAARPAVVERRHALHLAEGHAVAVVEAVPLGVVAVDGRALPLGQPDDDGALGVLAVGVAHDVRGAEVGEGEARRAHHLRGEEGDGRGRGVARGVPGDKVRARRLGGDDDVEAREHGRGDGRLGEDGDLDVGVQLGEGLDGGGGAGLADVGRGEVVLGRREKEGGEGGECEEGR